MKYVITVHFAERDLIYKVNEYEHDQEQGRIKFTDLITGQQKDFPYSKCSIEVVE